MYILVHYMASKLKNICTKFQVDRFISFWATFPGAKKLTIWEKSVQSFRSWKVKFRVNHFGDFLEIFSVEISHL